MRIIIQNAHDNIVVHDDGVIQFSGTPELKGLPCWDLRKCAEKCFDKIASSPNGSTISLSCARQTDRYEVYHLGTTILLYNIAGHDAEKYGLAQYKDAIDCISIGIIRYHNASGFITLANKRAIEYVGDEIKTQPIGTIIPGIESLGESMRIIDIKGTSYKCKTYPVICSDSVPVLSQIEIHSDERWQEGLSLLKSGVLSKILTTQQYEAYKIKLAGGSQAEGARQMDIALNTYSQHLSEAQRRIMMEIPEVAALIDGLMRANKK